MTGNDTFRWQGWWRRPKVAREARACWEGEERACWEENEWGGTGMLGGEGEEDSCHPPAPSKPLVCHRRRPEEHEMKSMWRMLPATAPQR